MTNTTNCFWPKLTALSHLGKSLSQVEAEEGTNRWVSNMNAVFSLGSP